MSEAMQELRQLGSRWPFGRSVLPARRARGAQGARGARRASWRATLGVLGVALLAGCTAIPSSGPVNVGLSDLQQAEQFLQFNPSGPVAGASQEDIVRGFVLAATSSADDYSVAREFLSGDYATQWDPSFGVLVDDGTRPYHSDSDSSGVLSLSALGKVDAQGLMLPVEPGHATDLRFEFEQVKGEWRISSAPSGIILDSTNFTSIWSAHQLYFVGAGNYLVPETRWFLNRAAIPTEIVSALLDGPSERVREVVRSGFPAGTRLVNGTVPVTEGRARIDLTSEVLDATPKALAELNQQLRASLQTVAGVGGFELFVDGTPLRAPTEQRGDAPTVFADSSTPAVLVDGQFGVISGGEFAPIEGLDQRVVDTKPDAISLAHGQTMAAVRNEAGVARVSSLGTTVTVDERDGLLSPSIDAFGVVWSVQRAHAEEIVVAAQDGTTKRIQVPWLAGRKPVAVRISPEGSRIAALVPDGNRSLVLVAGVVRDQDGLPTATTDDAEVQLWAAGAPVDLDWVGMLRFGVLTHSDKEGATKVTIGGPGLFSTEQGAVPGGASITGGGTRSQLRVLSSGGELFVPQNSGWQRVLSGIEVLAKRG